jgi:hypothetical protein
MIKSLIPIGFLLALVSVAAAQEGPKPVGTFERWTAYSYAERGQPVCYAAASPAKSDGKLAKRGDVFMLVTHRPGQKTLDVVSFVAGYPFKKGDQAELTIGKDTFKLFTEQARAWAPDDKTDHAIVQAMAKGNEMAVRGNPERGAAMTDIFSLKGFAKAYEAIGKACKVKR